MKNETIKKAAKNNYDFVIKTKIYYQANREKMQKISHKYYKTLSDNDKNKRNYANNRN